MTVMEAEGDELREARMGSDESLPSPEERLADWVELTIRVPDDKMATWEGQAAQYPLTGPPGISYLRGHAGNNVFVDCLLYRDDSGELVGILNHYPTDIPPLQHAGDENIWVHPDRRRQGIGTALALESSIRWTAKAPTRNPGDVRLTESGAQWVMGTEGKIVGITRVLPAAPEVVYREWLDPESLRHWITPRPSVVKDIEIDGREGASYRFEIEEAGSTYSVVGRYLVLDPPRGLAFTWRSSSWEPTTPDSWVSVAFEPHDSNCTLMTLRQGQLAADHRDGYRAIWERVAVQFEDKLTLQARP